MLNWNLYYALIGLYLLLRVLMAMYTVWNNTKQNTGLTDKQMLNVIDKKLGKFLLKFSNK